MSKEMFYKQFEDGVLVDFELLLKQSDINFVEEVTGMSYLHYSVLGNNRENTAALIKNGININMRDKKGNTALHYALSKGYRQCASVLITHGANLFLINNKHVTPFDVAAAFNIPLNKYGVFNV